MLFDFGGFCGDAPGSIPSRPLAPFRNLLYIGLKDASANPATPMTLAPLVCMGVLVAPRPFGAQDLASLVGDS